MGRPTPRSRHLWLTNYPDMMVIYQMDEMRVALQLAAMR